MKGMEKSDKKWIFISLTFIILIGALLRFWAIKDRGFLYPDSALYAQEGKSFYLPGRWLLFKVFSGKRATMEPLREYLSLRGAAFPFTDKIGHNFLIALGYLFFGLEDYSIFIISSISGILTIILVFFIGSIVYDRKVGIIAAAVLAVSAYHIKYSRSGLGQANAALFSTLGIYLYLLASKSHKRQNLFLFLAGLSVGFACITHHTLYLMPFIILLFELISFMRSYRKDNEPFLNYLKRWLILAVSISFFPLSMELLYQIHNIFLTPKRLPYLATLLLNFSTASGVEGAFRVGDPYAYFRLICKFEGWIVSIFLIIGLVYSLRRIIKERSHEGLFLLLVLFVSLAVWTVFAGPYPRVRTFTYVLPVIALISALGVNGVSLKVTSALGKRVSTSLSLLECLFVILIIVYGVFNSREVIAAKSSFKEATLRTIEYAKVHGGVITGNYPIFNDIYRFYIGNALDKLPEEKKGVIKLHTSQIGDYLIASPQMAFYSREYRRWYRELKDKHKPIFSISDRMFEIPFDVYYERTEKEYLERLRQEREEYCGEDTFIHIYDLRQDREGLEVEAGYR